MVCCSHGVVGSVMLAVDAFIARLSENLALVFSGRVKPDLARVPIQTPTPAEGVGGPSSRGLAFVSKRSNTIRYDREPFHSRCLGIHTSVEWSGLGKFETRSVFLCVSRRTRGGCCVRQDRGNTHAV